MADELKITSSLGCVNGYYDFSQNATNVLDQTGERIAGEVMDVSNVAATAIDLNDIANTGWSYFRNLDLEDSLTIGIVDGVYIPMLKLKAGEFAVLLWAGTQPYALADTNAVQLDFTILELSQTH